mgnify:CR=1 FL=1
MMSNIRDRNTKPELLLRKHLHSLGIRFRLNQKVQGIKPDLVLKKYQTCIFVHGCFWHRHACSRSSIPKKNNKYWELRLQRNQHNDLLNCLKLADLGYDICIIWECETTLSNYSNIEDKLAKYLSSDQNFEYIS